MTKKSADQYVRVAKAIDYIRANFKTQPSLDSIAQAVNLSPYYFQRLFSTWAGVSPKQFLQYLSAEYAKQLLKNEQATLFDTAYETGLSGTGRLHDLFIKIEGMTPGEFKRGGASLVIHYSLEESPFGMLLVASTKKGICHMAFEESEKQAKLNLIQRFPNAVYKQKIDNLQIQALSIFKQSNRELSSIKLHLQGTPFQLNVWKTLLKIPRGHLTTYGTIAKEINKPKAARAVGTAIGSNPIAFLIPCHRVIQATGNLGGYMWGETRKSAIIGWEASTLEHPNIE